MNIYAADLHIAGGSIEVLVFQLADGAAVHRVGHLRAEACKVQAFGTAADLLIRGEGDFDLAVLQVRMGKKIFRHVHDLCDAGLVVGAQKGGSVGNHQVIADGRHEIGKCLRREDKPVPQGNIAAVIVFHDAGLYACSTGGR